MCCFNGFIEQMFAAVQRQEVTSGITGRPQIGYKKLNNKSSVITEHVPVKL